MDLERVQRQEAALVVSSQRSRPRHAEGKLPGVRQGLDYSLEEQADEILWRDRCRFYSQERNPGTHFLPYDILSPDQLKLRWEREVSTGRLDEFYYPGVYYRAYNPLAGKRHPRIGEDIAYDRRVGMIKTGGGSDPWSIRDKGLCPIDRRYWSHLNRGQRCRIRAAMRKVPRQYRRLAKATLAVKYGVEPYVISRICSKK